jgi:hypothetical protein
MALVLFVTELSFVADSTLVKNEALTPVSKGLFYRCKASGVKGPRPPLAPFQNPVTGAIFIYNFFQIIFHFLFFFFFFRISNILVI